MTLSLFLLVYLVFIALFILFVGVNLYHLITGASLTFVSFWFTFFIFAATIFVLYFTTTALLEVQWDTPLFQSSVNAYTEF